jgi:16S rRNA (uracil1498-N3)-methyltransferase
MEIADTARWDEFLTHLPAEATVLLGDPSGDPWPSVELGQTGPLFLCVGPEGGLTPEEVESGVQRGARLVCLGRNILRVETAGLALAALALAGFEQ